MTIYIDADYKCHATDTGGLTNVETDFFNGKCAEYIAGYRFIPSGETWIREDGKKFTGEMITPFVDPKTLNEYQRNYELEIAKEKIAELEEALNLILSGVTE